MTDGKTALSELIEISTQIEAAVLVGADDKVAATNLRDDRAIELAASARTLLEEASRFGAGELTHLEAVTSEGSLFVVRDGGLLVAASTGAEPTAGLVFYDLKACLRRAAAEPKPKAKTKPKAKRQARPKSSGTP